MPDLIERRRTGLAGRNAHPVAGVIVQLGEIGGERIATEFVDVVTQRMLQLAGGNNLPGGLLPLPCLERVPAQLKGRNGPVEDRDHNIGAGLRGIGGRLPQLPRGGSNWKGEWHGLLHPCEAMTG